MKYEKKYPLFAGICMLVAVSVSVSCNRMTGNTNANADNISFDGKVFEKTSFKEIVKKGTKAEIIITDDLSWSTYCTGGSQSCSTCLKGVFLKGRKVRLSPFALCQYEVTQKLYEEIMGHNPSNFATGTGDTLRPVETVSWYDAIVFCNKLSLKAGLKPYYTIEGKDIDWEAIQYDEVPDETKFEWDKVTFDKSGNGFRLPTEAEWEFAARGGDVNDKAWTFAFSCTQCAKLDPAQFLNTLTDAKLDEYGWYRNNSGNKTHVVGGKKPNRLGLYDMSGNVEEWCFDWSANLQIDGTVEDDPCGGPRPAIEAPARITRGGPFYQPAFDCAVSRINWYYPHRRANHIGIRLARSLP